MKAEVIREIVEASFYERNGAHPLAYPHIVDDECQSLAHNISILEQAGFVVLPKEELEAALKGMLRHAPLIPDHFTDTTFVDVPATAKSVRRAAALLAAITQEKSDGL